jgi:hypothetical protein
MMGGEINWAALDFVCELFGIVDVEKLITHLIAIRDRPK